MSSIKQRQMCSRDGSIIIWYLGLSAAIDRSMKGGHFVEASVCAVQDAPTSTEQEIDYGSKQANEAVKQLQQLGAIVYPPAEKKDVDWGLLAGIVLDPFSCSNHQIGSAEQLQSDMCRVFSAEAIFHVPTNIGSEGSLRKKTLQLFEDRPT